jgi:hypothetical protein
MVENGGEQKKRMLAVLFIAEAIKMSERRSERFTSA